MNKILRHHFAMSAADFPAHREEPTNSVIIQEIVPTAKGVQERVGAIEYDWINKDYLYGDEALERRIGGLRVLDLYDGKQNIGYALICPPEHPKAFQSAANGEQIIEIENLAFYEGHRGHGKGWQYFTKVMDELFSQYDHVYWSQSETNHATLKDYYERKGMNYLGSDIQDDFREQPEQQFIPPSSGQSAQYANRPHG